MPPFFLLIATRKLQMNVLCEMQADGFRFMLHHKT